MSNNQEQLSFYRKMAELQEKLRKSEEEKAGLEAKFQVMTKNGRAMDEARLSSLKHKYSRFLEDDKRRKVRNERILTALDKIEKHTAVLTAKTERLKLLRRHFDAYMARTYPAWKDRIKDPKEMQQNIQNFTPVQPSTPNFGQQIRSPGFQPSFTNPQESFRNYNPSFTNPFQTSDKSQPQFMNQRFASDQNQQPLMNQQSMNQQYQQSMNQPYQQPPTIQAPISYTSKENENFKSLMKDIYKINMPSSLQSKPDYSFGQKSTALRQGDIENIRRDYNDLATPLTDSLLEQHTEFNTSRDLLSVTFDDDSVSKDLSKNIRLDENKENKVPVNVNYKTPIPSLNLEKSQQQQQQQQKVDTSEDEEVIIKKLTKISSFDEDISEGKDYSKHEDPLDTKLDKDGSEIEDNFDDDFQPDNRPGTSMGNRDFDDEEFDNEPPEPLHNLKPQNLGYHRNDLLQPRAHDLNYIHEEQYPPEDMSNVAMDDMNFESQQPEFDDRIIEDTKNIAPLQEYVPVGPVELEVVKGALQDTVTPYDQPALPVDTKIYEHYQSEKIRPPEFQKNPEHVDYQRSEIPQNFKEEFQREPQNVDKQPITRPVEFEQSKYVPKPVYPEEVEPKYSPKSQRSFENEEPQNFTPLSQPVSQRSFEREDMIPEQRSLHKDVPYEKSNVQPYFEEEQIVQRNPEMAPPPKNTQVEKQYEPRQQEYQGDVPQSYRNQQIRTPEKQQFSKPVPHQQEIPYDRSVDQSYGNQQIKTPEKMQYTESVTGKEDIPYDRSENQRFDNQQIRTPEKQQYTKPNQQDIPYERSESQRYENKQIRTPEKQQYTAPHQQDIPYDRSVDQSYGTQQNRTPEKQQYAKPNQQDIPYERSESQIQENQPIRTPEKQQYAKPLQSDIPYDRSEGQRYENQQIRTPEKQQYIEPVTTQRDIPYERSESQSHENQQIRTPEKQQYSEPISQNSEQNISYARSENPSQDEFSEQQRSSHRDDNVSYGNQEPQYEPEKYITEDQQPYDDYPQEPIYEGQNDIPEEQFDDRREGFEPQYRAESNAYDQRQEEYVEQPKYYEEPERYVDRNETIVEEDETVDRDVYDEQPQRYESQDVYRGNEYTADDRREFVEPRKEYDSQEHYEKGAAEYYDESKPPEVYREPNYQPEQVVYPPDPNYPRDDERYTQKPQEYTQDQRNLPPSQVYPEEEMYPPQQEPKYQGNEYQPENYPIEQQYPPNIQQPIIEESPEIYPQEDQNYTEPPKKEQPYLQEQSYSEYSDDQKVTPQESQEVPQAQGVRLIEGFREMELNAPVSDRGDTDTLAELDSSDFTTTSSEVKPASVASDLHSGSLAQPASQVTSSDEVERQMAALVSPPQPPPPVVPQPAPPVPQAVTPPQKTAPPKSSPPSGGSATSKTSKPASGSRPTSATSRNKPGSPASSKSASSSSPTASKSGSVAGSKTAVRSPAAKKPLHK